MAIDYNVAHKLNNKGIDFSFLPKAAQIYRENKIQDEALKRQDEAYKKQDAALATENQKKFLLSTALTASNLDTNLGTEASVNYLNETKAKMTEQGQDTSDIDLAIRVATEKPENFKNFLQQSIGAISGKTISNDSRSFAPVDLADGGKAIPFVDEKTKKVTLVPIEGTVSKTDQKKAESEIKTSQAVDEVKALESGSKEKQLKLESDKVNLDATRAKTEQEAKDIINKKTTNYAESDNSIKTIDTLLNNDLFDKSLGKIVNNTPDLLKSQDSLDAIALKDQIISLLSLESREKLKGQGSITDSEAKTLEKSATTLANPLISKDVAKKELERVRMIFQKSKERNTLNSNEKIASERINSNNTNTNINDAELYNKYSKYF